MLISAFFLLATILSMMYMPDLGLKHLLALFFVLGFTASSQLISYPLIIESNAPELSASATGFSCIFTIINGLVMPAFSWLLELNWNGLVVSGIPFYERSNYNLAFMWLIFAAIASVGITLIIKERNH